MRKDFDTYSKMEAPRNEHGAKYRRF